MYCQVIWNSCYECALLLLYTVSTMEATSRAVPSRDGIPLWGYRLFSFSCHRRKWNSQRQNTMKEILYWPGILGKPSYS